MPSPTERTLKLLRKLWYSPVVVEKWNDHIKCRQDLLGFIDILALGRGEILGVQSTTTDNLAKRVNKILGLDPKHENVGNNARIWLTTGARIYAIGWYPDGRYRTVEVIMVKGELVSQPLEQIIPRWTNSPLGSTVTTELE